MHSMNIRCVLSVSRTLNSEVGLILQVVKPLTWKERVRILTLTGCAVLYLHSSVPPYVHLDIKSYVGAPCPLLQ